MGMVTKLVAKVQAQGQAQSQAPKMPTNAELTRNVGLSLDTILTPKNKRKKSAGLRGADPEETLSTTLGG
jgi:hypothetical protein